MAQQITLGHPVICCHMATFARKVRCPEEFFDYLADPFQAAAFAVVLILPTIGCRFAAVQGRLMPILGGGAAFDGGIFSGPLSVPPGGSSFIQRVLRSAKGQVSQPYSHQDGDGAYCCEDRVHQRHARHRATPHGGARECEGARWMRPGTREIHGLEDLSGLTPSEQRPIEMPRD